MTNLSNRLARLESAILPTKPYRPRFNRFLVELPAESGELTIEIYEGDFTNLVEVKNDRSIPNL